MSAELTIYDPPGDPPAAGAEPSGADLARKYLAVCLETACRTDEGTDELAEHVPPLAALHPSAIGVLLDFEILSVKELPVVEAGTLRRLFEASVRVGHCIRPRERTPRELLRQTQPGRRDDTFTYECREFADGDWLFIDAALVRGEPG